MMYQIQIHFQVSNLFPRIQFNSFRNLVSCSVVFRKRSINRFCPTVIADCLAKLVNGVHKPYKNKHIKPVFAEFYQAHKVFQRYTNLGFVERFNDAFVVRQGILNLNINELGQRVDPLGEQIRAPNILRRAGYRDLDQLRRPNVNAPVPVADVTLQWQPQQQYEHFPDERNRAVAMMQIGHRTRQQRQRRVRQARERYEVERNIPRVGPDGQVLRRRDRINRLHADVLRDMARYEDLTRAAREDDRRRARIS